MAEEPREREHRNPERERHVERTVDRRSNTTGIAAVIGGLVIAVLLIWWLVGGFTGTGGEEQIVLESDVETTEQVGTGAEAETAPVIEGEAQEPALEEPAEEETQIVE